MNSSEYNALMRRFTLATIVALQKTEALPLAAGLYSMLRAGVRFFGYALPGQCTNTVINLSLSVGVCAPAGSWLITRVSQDTSAHAWSWIMYGGFAVIVALWQRPKGSFNGWRAFMLVGFAVAVHELFWFFTYFVVHPIPSEILFNLEVYGSFIAMCAIGLLIFYVSGCFSLVDTRVLLVGIGALGLFYAGWAAIGYPLTLDLKIGVNYPLFNSGWVDFIEYASWLFMFVITGAAYYAKQIRS